MAKLSPAKLKKLKAYFEKREDVAFAFLFGSYAKGTATKRSDADVGVYFKPAGRAIEWEENRNYSQENEVWSTVERILGRDADLVVLNRAPATLADAALREGLPLAINDNNLYWRFFLLIGLAAEDFRIFTKDFLAIKHRSASLSENDAYRLGRILDYIGTEVKDFGRFTGLTQKQYTFERTTRLVVERWAESLVNAAIDVAKLLLGSEKKPVPDRYEDILRALCSLDGFPEQAANALAPFAKLRNILAHEYFDIRFDILRKFIDEAEPLYRALADFARGFLERK